MNRAKGSENKRLVNRSQIARAVFAAAESMGIADREKVERITGQVIQRLEQTKSLPEAEQPLPGLEDLVSAPRRRQRRLPKLPTR